MGYEKYNAENVLEKVEQYINWLDNPEKSSVKITGYYYFTDELISSSNRHYYKMRDVYNDLSIFDWWSDTLSKSQLKDMRKFLNEAIKLGYKGYVCFKVGVSGSANGMWAFKDESSDGYSPDGACIYKSFTPEYECWSVSKDGSNFYPDSDEWNSANTIKKFEGIVRMVEA